MSTGRTPPTSAAPPSGFPGAFSGQILTIHYSCENVQDCPDRTPQVSAIVVQDVAADEYHTFATYLIAERRGLLPEQIDQNSTDLERQLLEEFYAFVAAHPSHYWLHWNMKEVWFGFSALEQRAAVLGVPAVAIPMDRRINLAAVLVQAYGDRYVPHPRLKNVIERNDINTRGLLSKDEAQAAWDQGKYTALAISARRKVDCIARIYDLYCKGVLRVDRPPPRWDADRRELRYGDAVIKSYTRPAPEQEKILAAFEESGWPERIDDPLDPGKLRDVLKNLNTALGDDSPIQFGRDGTGEGITWSVSPSRARIN